MIRVVATGYLAIGLAVARALERHDCGPRPCPWCGAHVQMALRGVGAAGAYITCPNCTKRVTYYEHRGATNGWHWACHASGAPQALGDGFARALNTCRPCPWVSCRHHLYLEVHPETGALKINFPGTDPHMLAESCSLDVADRGGMTLKEVGDLMNLTRERIRQLEVKGKRELRGHTSKMTDD